MAAALEAEAARIRAVLRTQKPKPDDDKPVGRCPNISTSGALI